MEGTIIRQTQQQCEQVRGISLAEKNADSILLEPELDLLQEFRLARQQAGLTQAEVANKMGTKPPAITRLEAALITNRHSPTLSTLKKYAQAVGCKLKVQLVPVTSE